MHMIVKNDDHHPFDDVMTDDESTVRYSPHTTTTSICTRRVKCVYNGIVWNDMCAVNREASFDVCVKQKRQCTSPTQK